MLLISLWLLSACTTTGNGLAAGSRAAPAISLTTRDDGSTLVTVSADAAFQYDSSELQPPIATELVNKVQGLQGQALVVSAYTDNVGAAAYNQTLSQQRAQAIADALTAAGFGADRTRVHGYGEADPVASNETAAGRRQNRRIELLFSAVP